MFILNRFLITTLILPNFRSSKIEIKPLKKKTHRLNLPDVSDAQYPSSVKGCLQVSDLI